VFLRLITASTGEDQLRLDESAKETKLKELLEEKKQLQTLLAEREQKQKRLEQQAQQHEAEISGDTSQQGNVRSHTQIGALARLRILRSLTVQQRYTRANSHSFDKQAEQACRVGSREGPVAAAVGTSQGDGEIASAAAACRDRGYK